MCVSPLSLVYVKSFFSGLICPTMMLLLDKMMRLEECIRIQQRRSLQTTVHASMPSFSFGLSLGLNIFSDSICPECLLALMMHLKECQPFTVGIPHEFYLFIFPPFYEQNQKECFLLKIVMFHLSKNS